jgi:hypothetical protein
MMLPQITSKALVGEKRTPFLKGTWGFRTRMKWNRLLTMTMETGKFDRFC